MKFYSNLNLQQNELLQALLENVDLQLGTVDEVVGIKGQIAYNTADDLVYIHNGTDWLTIGSAAEITVAGGTSVDVTDGTFTLNQMDGQTITIDHADITRTDTTSSGSPELGTGFTVVDSVTTDAQGHITAVNVKTVSVLHPDLDSAYATTADNTTTLGDIEFLVELSVDGQGHVSDAQFRKLVAGLDLVATAAADGTVTFAHKTVTTSTSSETAAPNFEQTFTAIDQLTIDNGHVTDIRTKTVTMPTETDLSLVDNGTGTWLTGVAVDDHEVTLSRSNTTEDTITVGELVVDDTNSSGDLTVAGNGSIGGNLTVTGDLTVEGTTTTLDTQTLLVEDNILTINSNFTGDPSGGVDGGIEVERGTGTNYQFLFVEATDDFRIGEAGDLQPVLTRDETTNLVADDLLVWDAANNRAIGKKAAELGVTRKVAFDLTADLGDNANEVVTHNLGTRDIQVTLYDVTGGQNPEVVYADFAATSDNAITFYFGNLPATNQFRVVILG